MKAILTIGYTSYLLPSDKGLAGIMAALSKAKEVRSDNSHVCYGHNRRVEVRAGDVGVEVSLIPDKVKIITTPEREPEEPLGLPEHGYREPEELLGLPEHGTPAN